MKKIRHLFVFAFLLIAGTNIWAEALELKNLVSPQIYDVLVKNGEAEEIYIQKNSDFKLLPETVYKKNCLENSLKKYDSLFHFETENLYLIPKSKLGNKAENKSENLKISDVSVVFRSLSKMEGLRYFSLNRNKEDILYKACYMVDSADGKNKIPDQTEGSADGKRFYVFQNDTSFGKCVYEFNYHQTENQFCINFHNLEHLGVGPFKAVSPENMRLNIVVIDCGDDFLLYFNSNTNCSKLPGIAKYLTNSLTARMKALEQWFENSF